MNDLRLDGLHERHPGLTPALGESYTRLDPFQPIQIISFLLAHRDSFHPLALRLSRGTFYLAQTGTSHLAATPQPRPEGRADPMCYIGENRCPKRNESRDCRREVPTSGRHHGRLARAGRLPVGPRTD